MHAGQPVWIVQTVLFVLHQNECRRPVHREMLKPAVARRHPAFAERTAAAGVGLVLRLVLLCFWVLLCGSYPLQVQTLLEVTHGC